MSNRTSQKQKYTARRVKVSSLYLSGKRQNEIATVIGVSQQTVSNDLKAIRAEWQRQHADTFDTIVAEQMVRLDKVEREAWESFERSKLDGVAVSQRKDETGAIVQTTQKSKRDGDPRYLQIVCKCIEQRLKIVGGYASDRDRAKRNDSLEQWQRDMIAEIKNGATAESMKAYFTHDEIVQLFGLAGVAMGEM